MVQTEKKNGNEEYKYEGKDGWGNAGTHKEIITMAS